MYGRKKERAGNMKKAATFEAAMKRLEAIVEKLENGNESLEHSLKLFEEGTSLTSFCYQILDHAEQKVVELTELEEKEAQKQEEKA